MKRVFKLCLSFSKRIGIVLLICLCSLETHAESEYEYAEELLYCPMGVRLDYSYANVTGGHETFPLGFGLCTIIPTADRLLGFSMGSILGGNWKKQHYYYSKNNYDYDLTSRFYWMGTLGIESGFMALQVGLGVCAAEYSKKGATQMASDGVYYTSMEMHKQAFFMVEPAAYINIPIWNGYKIPIKIAYQFVPAAPIMNGLVIGGGIRFSFEERL